MARALITTVLFDNNYELIHDRTNLKEIKPLIEKEYCVGGMTALLDAVGMTINKIVAATRNTKKEYQADKVMFVIITDGMENASAQKIGVEWEEFGRGFLTTQDYQMLVSQIDTGDYPKVKLFLQIKNLATGETININKFDKFSLTEDISGSMQYDIDHVKNVMKDFLGYMQFNTGDRA